MKRLIVNADDFGLTTGINRAIIECHQSGIVTSATLMANSAAFDDAVQLAKQNPRLSVGCHVTLMDGEPLSPASEVTSLLSNGREFHRTISAFAPRAIANRFRPAEIEAEALAQFRRIQQAGITISHFDAHKHAHMFPSVAEPLMRAARACGITRVRNPFEGALILPLGKLLSKSLNLRWLQVVALRTFAARFRALAAQYGITTPSGSIGIVATGSISPNLMADMLDRLADGTWEFVCHPGYNDADLAAVRTKLRASRDIEREVLLSDTTRKFLNHNEIQLISYNELNT